MAVRSSQMSRSQSADVLIVGAGVTGCSIAASAAAHGLQVIAVDPLSSPGFGSTSASAGITRVHAGDRESSVLADESIYAWEQWKDTVKVPEGEPAAHFTSCGSYILEDDTGSLDKFAEIMRASRAAFEELDGEALAEAIPWADTRKFGPPAQPESPEFWRKPKELIGRALYTPRTGYISEPSLAAQNLASLAQWHGARFIFRRQVVGVVDAPSGTLNVTLNDGSTYNAASIVNAAGPASFDVNRVLGVGKDFRVGQRIVRQELHHIVRTRDSKGASAHVVDGDLGINFRSEGANGFLVGSSGALVDGEETLAASESFVDHPTRDLWYRHVARAAKRIPGVEIPPKPVGLAGLYDVTDDWLPIYDKTDRQGVFIAAGTSGNQFKNAPFVGEVMLELMMAAADGKDTDTTPVMVTLPHTGRSIDTSVFSRLRRPQAGGSRG